MAGGRCQEAIGVDREDMRQRQRGHIHEEWGRHRAKLGGKRTPGEHQQGKRFAQDESSKGGIYTFNIKVPREKNIQTGNRFSALAEEDNGQEEHIVEECGEEAWMHAGRPGFSRQGVW